VVASEVEAQGGARDPISGESTNPASSLASGDRQRVGGREGHQEKRDEHDNGGEEKREFFARFLAFLFGVPELTEVRFLDDDAGLRDRRGTLSRTGRSPAVPLPPEATARD